MKIVLIRSPRRRKTISGRIKGNRLEIRIPSWLSEKKALNIAAKFLKKTENRRVNRESSEFLIKRARQINKRYFRGGLKSFTVNWSERQKVIFGICDRKKRAIRISSRLKKAPPWVIDYLILHEMAHLLEANHGKRFWRIVNQYPRTEKAKGFLQGMNFNN